MKIIIDVMGSDKGARELLKGVVAAAKKCRADFILVGDERVIKEYLKNKKWDMDRIQIVGTETVVTMEDDPISVLHTKKDSSMLTALRMLSENKADALLCAGNTGALFAGATLIVKCAKGVRRAAIGTVLPGEEPCLLLDAGANVTATEEYLVQFAYMGSEYMKSAYGIENPRVCLLNNGTEECKGTALQVETYKRLREDNRINFCGNVEAVAVLNGVCHVVVCDGFTGNIFLKATEGVGKVMLKALKEVYSDGILAKLSYLFVKNKISGLKKRFHPSSHGGSLIFGISKPVVKAHGSSDAVAFENAILQTIEFVKNKGVFTKEEQNNK